MDFDPTEHPHRRCKHVQTVALPLKSLSKGSITLDNPLTGEHVLVSPHRTKRPWQGQIEPPLPSNLPEYDPKCYLCPGNSRSGGQANPKYESTHVFVSVPNPLSSSVILSHALRPTISLLFSQNL
jgi:UDPglucose--hexose-1-phosphate uridylyltransferase